MLFYLFTSSIILFVYFLFYLGTFTRVKITKEIYKPISIVYTQYIGNYNSIGAKIGEVCNEAKNFFRTESCLGIYYNDPKELQNPSLARATIAVLLQEGENPDKFLDKFPQKYKFAKINEGEVLYSKFPYRNIFSILIGHIFKVHPKLITEGKKTLQREFVIVEVYNMGGSNKSLEYFIPLNEKAYQLYPN